MTPSKSMPQKSNHYFKEKYPYVHVGTLVSTRATDIFSNHNFKGKYPYVRVGTLVSMCTIDILKKRRSE